MYTYNKCHSLSASLPKYRIDISKAQNPPALTKAALAKVTPIPL